MGDHFVPQQHLKRFECREQRGFIWMYDKEKLRFAKLPIKQVAQAPGFYPKRVEAELANSIEAPSNAILKKIRSKENLNSSERRKLAQYILTMATRGPAYRQRILKEIGPSAMEDTFSDIESALNRKILEEDHEVAKAQLPKLLAEKAKASRTLPQVIIDFSRKPFWSPSTVEHIANMAWRIAPSPPGLFYITSDTPTHIFREVGVGSKESEITFPIARDLALIGDHTGNSGTIEYVEAQPHIVREVNHRILNVCDRFVFAHTDAEWIPSFAANPAPANPYCWVPFTLLLL